MSKDISELLEKPRLEVGGVHSTNGRVYMFVADGMNIGGIETLLVRMANQIANLGYRVIVVAQNGPCMESVDSKVTVFQLVPLKSLFAQLKLVPVDYFGENEFLHIWSATPYSLVSIYKYQQHLNRRQGIQSVSVSGIFGPARSIQGLRHRYDMMEHLLVLGWLPNKSVYFMSEAVQKTYVQQFGKHFSEWPIHRLTLNEPNLIWSPRGNKTLKIVSIGRITKLKPYNFGALDVVEFMIKKNIPVHWDIWGHGDESTLLERAIHDRGLSSHIKFHGELPYSNFSRIVLEADLFVGMGTAALESAQLGLPTLVAIAWSKLGTYGFLHQCPHDSIGEQYADIELSSLIDFIHAYSSYSPGQRVELGLRCREAVSKKTSGDAPPFDALFEGGIRFPSSLIVSLRMKTFGVAQIAWNFVKVLVNIGKKIGRLVRANG